MDVRWQVGKQEYCRDDVRESVEPNGEHNLVRANFLETNGRIGSNWERSPCTEGSRESLGATASFPPGSSQLRAFPGIYAGPDSRST